MPDPRPVPLRVDYTALAVDAAPDKEGDPSYRVAVANEAMRLEPLKQIRVAFDQSFGHAESVARGEPWAYAGGGFTGHVEAVLDHAQRRLDVLDTAADAAAATIAEFRKLLNLEKAMNKHHHKDDAADPAEGEHPQLTTTGEPHPLEKGGYDADADPGLPGNISDVEALKEGKTTHAQAAAIGAADAQDAADDEADAKAEEKAARKADAKKAETKAEAKKK